MKQKLILLYSLMVCCLQADNTSFIFEVSEENGRWRLRADNLLLHGNLEPLAEAYERKDLLDLWYHFGLASAGQYFGQRDSDRGGALISKPKYTSDQEKELNAKIKTKAGELLARLPNHAEFMSDYLERFAVSDDALEYSNVTNCLGLMEKLGSPECVRKLMHYLDDERRPGDKYWGGMSSGGTRPRPISYEAITGLDRVFGEMSPIGAECHSNQGFSVGQVPAARAKLKAWWASDAAKPFREHGRVKNVALAALRQGSAGDSKPIKPTEADYGWSWNPWLTGGVLALVILAVTWFAAKRR